LSPNTLEQESLHHMCETIRIQPQVAGSRLTCACGVL
jgi:hypothetical protein